jgi:hypothetical protein
MNVKSDFKGKLRGNTFIYIEIIGRNNPNSNSFTYRFCQKVVFYIHLLRDPIQNTFIFEKSLYSSSFQYKFRNNKKWKPNFQFIYPEKSRKNKNSKLLIIKIEKIWKIVIWVEIALKTVRNRHLCGDLIKNTSFVWRLP